MRFLIGMLGGVLCAATVALVVVALSIALGIDPEQPFSLAAAVLFGTEAGEASPLAGLLIYVITGAVLGGVFTTVMCGKVATGPAIGIGLVYGFSVYVLLRFILLPLLDPDLVRDTALTALLGRCMLFGGLMGAWVIAASHFWPKFSIKCE